MITQIFLIAFEMQALKIRLLITFWHHRSVGNFENYLIAKRQFKKRSFKKDLMIDFLQCSPRKKSRNFASVSRWVVKKRTEHWKWIACNKYSDSCNSRKISKPKCHNVDDVLTLTWNHRCCDLTRSLCLMIYLNHTSEDNSHYQWQ